MNTLTSISERNNVGCSLLSRGNISEGIATFASAISDLKQVMLAPQSRDSKASLEPRPYAFSYAPLQVSCQDKLTVTSAAPSPSPFGRLYTKARRFHLPEDCSSDARQQSTHLALILIYNLALAHHCGMILASQDQARPAYSPFKVFRLYEQALRLAEDEILESVFAQDVSLLTGIWNNMAVLYASLGEETNASKCWAQVLEQLSAFDLRGSDCLDPRLRDEMHEFQCNVLMVFLKSVNAAPAA